MFHWLIKAFFVLPILFVSLMWNTFHLGYSFKLVAHKLQTPFSATLFFSIGAAAATPRSWNSFTLAFVSLQCSHLLLLSFVLPTDEEFIATQCPTTKLKVCSSGGSRSKFVLMLLRQMLCVDEHSLLFDSWSNGVQERSVAANGL